MLWRVAPPHGNQKTNLRLVTWHRRLSKLSWSPQVSTPQTVDTCVVCIDIVSACDDRTPLRTSLSSSSSSQRWTRRWTTGPYPLPGTQYCSVHPAIPVPFRLGSKLPKQGSNCRDHRSHWIAEFKRLDRGGPAPHWYIGQTPPKGGRREKYCVSLP